MKTPHEEQFDAYLSREIGLGDLPESLQGEERLLTEALEMVRVDEPAPAGLKAAVLNDIAREPRSRWRDAVAWLVRPRTIQLSPATGGLLAAAVITALVLLPPSATDPGSTGPATVVASDRPVLTRFVFVAPEASQVTLTGDWVDWDPDGIALTELRGSGVWTVDLPVPPGIHEYSFIVDGSEWRPDPLAGEPVDDGFGRANSVLMVASSEA